MSRFIVLTALISLTACDQILDPPEPFGECQASDGHDDLDIGAVTIDGDTLQVEVSYGGGCEEHEFEIRRPEQSFREEEPVSVSLEIWHGGRVDSCEAYLSEVLEFDLMPLQQAWKEGYGDSAGTIDIDVMGVGVSYSFE